MDLPNFESLVLRLAKLDLLLGSVNIVSPMGVTGAVDIGVVEAVLVLPE